MSQDNHIRKALNRRVSVLRRRIHDFHIKKTTIALILLLPYLASEWSARAYNLYTFFPQVDNLIHFSFGVAFAGISYLIYNKSKQFVLFGAFILSILWEVLEISGDHFV
ncbi:MAG TPA: hypothetical protein VKE88_00330, partial [Candidatus Nanoarchaeia archaeon]|nr:hypothetical protein [Candidatus Nanoarchaeia archaeon]